MMKFSLFGITDVGRSRTHNEDDFAICKDLSEKKWGFNRGEILKLSELGALLIVADGMGGENAGEVASNLAQAAVREDFDQLEKAPESVIEKEEFLAKSILRAHQAVVNYQHKNLETAGMGTTLVISWVIGDLVHVAWSGDSRCYIYNGQQSLYPFTEDHSLVWQMVEDNQMSPEEARVHPESNIVTQSLGDEKNPPQPSVKTAKLFKGNRLILCSDGLNGMLSDEQIQSILEEGGSIDETCGKLVKSANEAGGEDNITCLMVEIHEGPKPTSEDLVAQTQIESKTTTTQVLRKKNSNKNLAIAALFLVITVLAAWIYFDGSSPEVNAVPSTTPEEPPAQEMPDDSLENSYQPADMEEENSAEPAEEEPPAEISDPSEELPDEPTEDPVPDLPEDTNPPESADKPTIKPKESEKDSVKQQAKPVDKDSTVTVSPKDLESTKDTVSVAPVVSDSTDTGVKSQTDSVAVDSKK